ncbi:MAG: MFS transporter [Deltaproteobacteria bacterium]|nr:MFS transporter [Deltaproteobacteria bacterium]
MSPSSLIARFAVGRLFSVVGMQMAFITVSWDVYDRTRDPFVLGLVGLVQLVPVLLFTLPAGNIADRYPRRYVGIAAHTLMALALVGLAVASRASAPMYVVYTLLFAVGLARAFASPSTNTILPQLIPAATLSGANAWLSSSFELGVITGPALGGALLAATHQPLVPFACGAVGQLVFIGVLASMPPPPSGVHATQGKNARDVLAGLRFIRNTPVFLGAITLDLFAVLFGGAVALLPVFARDVLHVGPSALGWMRAAPSVGAMLMSLLATQLSPWRRPGLVLLLVVAGFGLASLGFGLSRSLAPALFFLFLTGVCDSISVVIRQTLEQVMTPDVLRGRVSAVRFVFIGFSNELGAFESGVTAAAFGPVGSVVFGGVGALLVVFSVAKLWPQLLALGPLTHAAPPPQAPPEAARGIR